MSDLLNQIRSMSPEEKAAFAAALKDLEPKPAPEAREIGIPMGDPRARDSYGNKLSAEEIYDRDHMPQHRAYGYQEISVVNGVESKRRWTNKEVDAYNRKLDEAFLAKKREIFPNASLPE